MDFCNFQHGQSEYYASAKGKSKQGILTYCRNLLDQGGIYPVLAVSGTDAIAAMNTGKFGIATVSHCPEIQAIETICNPAHSPADDFWLNICWYWSNKRNF